VSLPLRAQDELDSLLVIDRDMGGDPDDAPEPPAGPISRPGDLWISDKPAKNDLHPTMKPVALVKRAIRNSSECRDIVSDPFGGSGTTLIAAERTGRRARLIELDPKYIDVVVQRWQEQTGPSARLEQSGQKFSEIASKKMAAAKG
jgi:DNA modification methylase